MLMYRDWVRGTCMRKDSGKWMELCAHAVDEKDPKKFALLILEINSMLEAK